MIRDERQKPIPVIVPPDFDVNEGPCVMCGGSLDTGWECNDCGADHFHAVQALLAKRRLKDRSDG